MKPLPYSPGSVGRFTVDWAPVPRKPWAVRLGDGRALRRFDTAGAAALYAQLLSTRKDGPQ